MPLPFEIARSGNLGALGESLRVIALLGQGGMANVYLVLETGTAQVQRLAVVKQLRAGIADDPEFVGMFLDEGRLAARLNHANIVHTYDVGEHEGVPYLTMEYVEGVSLQTLLPHLARKEDGFSIRYLVRVLLDTLSGLQYAHSLRDFDGAPLGVVHRDVSPHNILIGFDGQVKLADFGIAKAASSSNETRTGVIKGKIRFMAPEQASGDAVDARADLYSVGVILWEALAGEKRFKGLSNAVVQQRLLSTEPATSPNGASRGYPPELDVLCVRALSPNAADRHDSAEAMAAALALAARDLPGGLPTNAELGALVSRLFIEDLERRRRLVQAAASFKGGDNAPSEEIGPISTSAETRLENEASGKRWTSLTPTPAPSAVDPLAANPRTPSPAAPPEQATAPAALNKPSPRVVVALALLGLLGAGAMSWRARSLATPVVAPTMVVVPPPASPPVVVPSPADVAPLLESTPPPTPTPPELRPRQRRSRSPEGVRGADAEAPTERN